MPALLRALCAALVVLHPVAGRCLDIQLIDISGMTPAQTAAFEEAVQIWESRYSDPIVVTLNVGFSDLPPDILGSTSTALVVHPYTNAFRSAMVADAQGIEKQAIGALPVIGSPIPPLKVKDQNGARVVEEVLLATANAKALGLSPAGPINPQPNQADGTVLFANDFAATFDYDRSDGIAADRQDFVAVAAHEIGHALGFVSATDLEDHPDNQALDVPPTTLDLWRFDDTNTAHTLGSPGPEPRRITFGAAEYYDSVQNNLDLSHGYYDTTQDPVCGTGSKRCQASHWSDDAGALMDPTLLTGVLQNPINQDAHAFDYIGYDRVPKLFYSAELLEALIKWFSENELRTPEGFQGYPQPPSHRDIRPPFEPDGAAVMALRWGGSDRSATAFYRFDPAGRYTGPHYNGFTSADVEEGQVIPFPDEPAPETSPDSFVDFYLESDSEGAFFYGVGALSVVGAGYDQEIGPNGGYRLDLLFFGEGDDDPEDVDGFGTYYFEADAAGRPDPAAQNVFRMSPTRESQLVVEDSQGLPEPGAISALAAGVTLLWGLGRVSGRRYP